MRPKILGLLITTVVAVSLVAVLLNSGFITRIPANSNRQLVVKIPLKSDHVLYIYKRKFTDEDNPLFYQLYKNGDRVVDDTCFGYWWAGESIEFSTIEDASGDVIAIVESSSPTLVRIIFDINSYAIWPTGDPYEPSPVAYDLLEAVEMNHGSIRLDLACDAVHWQRPSKISPP